MKHAIIWLVSSLVLSSGAGVLKTENQTLEWFELMDAEKIGCDTYKVFYNHDWKLKVKKGNLYELMQMGFSVNEILILTNEI